jgi:hypothetical protein
VTSAINRYYDPATDQFLSIDPDVASTDQPYVFTNDNPLNATDPLGLCFVVCFQSIANAFDSARHSVAANSGAIGIGFGLVALTLATGGADTLVIGGFITAEQVGMAAIGSGAVGTYLDEKSCKGGSGLGCGGEALGLLSGGSAAYDLVAASSKGVSLIAGDGALSSAAKISAVSGLVGLLVDAINYLEGGAKSKPKAPAPKKTKK